MLIKFLRPSSLLGTLMASQIIVTKANDLQLAAAGEIDCTGVGAGDDYFVIKREDHCLEAFAEFGGGGAYLDAYQDPDKPYGCNLEGADVGFNYEPQGAGDGAVQPICREAATEVFPTYKLGSPGADCSSAGPTYIPIPDVLATCQNIIDTGFKGSSFSFVRSCDVAQYPEGCYFLWDDALLPDAGFYGNMTSGSANPAAASVCKYIPGSNAGGDPHFHTLSNIFFSWQAECDSKLMESKSDNLLINVRTTRKRSYSYIEEAVVKIGDDLLEFDAFDGKLIRNGKHETDDVVADLYNITTTYFGSHKLIVYHHIHLGDNKEIEVKCNNRFHMLFFNITGDFPEDTTGLLGNHRRDGLYSRNGTKLEFSPNSTDMDEYGESWQVLETEEKLFKVNRVPQHPTKCSYESSTLRGSRRKLMETRREISHEEAAEACSIHHNKAMIRFCIQDVIAVGDVRLASDSFYY